MRLVLDQDRCQGHGQCVMVAPALFDLDEFGTALLIGPGQEPLTDEHAERAQLAVLNCPEQAIQLTD